jgi:hypothetical protein
VTITVIAILTFNNEAQAELQAGFASRDITPKVHQDEPIWIAGYARGRAAKSIHRPLMTTAMVLATAKTSIAIVSLDSIGVGFDDIARIRRQLQTTVDELIVASTHTHQAPDVIGLWGEKPTTPGWNQVYIDNIVKQTKAAVKAAKRRLKPAQLRYGHLHFPLENQLMQDSRPPVIRDPGIHVLQVSSNQKTLGQMVIWSNHPEAMGAKNTALSPDYPAILREQLDSGTTLFLVGAIGGLLSPESYTPIPTPKGQLNKYPGPDRAAAVGTLLAKRIEQALSKGLPPLPLTSFQFNTQTIQIPVANQNFLKGIQTGLIRGHTLIDKNIKTRVSLLRLGDLHLFGIPGEIYPEIIWGGIPNSQHTDFPRAPREEPPLQKLLKGAPFAVIGLADDEIGYILPKASWDSKPPNYLGGSKLFYGEQNSVGPDAGPRIYNALKSLLGQSESP